jgi:oligopeptide/dipeptide ABC transporter ATP-binding protein
MIAMALACRPAVLIADEPTTALDVTIQAQILQLMGTLKEQFGSSIIFITHDLAVIAGFADRVAVMYAGVVVETAPVRDLFGAPAHPYTQGLLASVPTLTQPKYTRDGRRHRLEAIPGTLPDPRQPVTGCRFAERCPHVMEHCRHSEPALTQVAPDQYARCYLHSNAARVETIDDSGPRPARPAAGGRRQ